METEMMVDGSAITNAIIITLKIKHKALFDFRVWLGTKLVGLGARVGGFGFEKNEEEEL